MGAALFNLLNSLSGSAAGVRDYDNLRNESVAAMVSALRPKAVAGDPEVQYDLHHLLFTEAMDKESTEHLAEAEHFLRLSAPSGHLRAAEDLLQWPLLKKSVERRARDKEA